MLGPRDPIALQTLSNVAQIAGTRDIERSAGALSELCQLLPAGDERRTENLDLFVYVAGAVAGQARDKGDLPTACEWVKRLLAAQDELHGPRSSESMVAAWTACDLLRNEGKMAEGASILIDRLVYVLSKDENALSPEGQQVRELVGRDTRDCRTRSGARLNETGMSEEAFQQSMERVNTASDAGRPFDAVDDLQQLADEVARRRGSFHPDTLRVNWMLWSAVGQSAGEEYRPRAIEQLRLISRAQRTQLGDDHPDLLNTLQNLAGVLFESGQSAEAARIDEQCLEVARKLHGINNPFTVAIACNTARSALGVRNFTGARSVFQSYLSWLALSQPQSLPAAFSGSREAAVALGLDLGFISQTDTKSATV